MLDKNSIGMKKWRFVIGVVIICLSISCHKKNRQEILLPELAEAESVMFCCPDSALHILQSMPAPSDREQHALWCLLVTQAQYKQMLPIPSDSLVRIAYDYYQSTDNARRKAMAAYYMGGVNYDLKNVVKATSYYVEADKEAEKTEDYTLRYLIASSLADVYLYRDLEDYAFKACQRAYDYSLKSPHREYESDALLSLGRAYSINNQLDTAIMYYDKAIDVADNSGMPELADKYRGELAGVYTCKGDKIKALSLMQESMAGGGQDAQSLYCLGEIYLGLEKYDSAYFCLVKALDTDNIYTRAAVYECLFQLSHQSEYRKSMEVYCDSLVAYRDSVLALDERKTIIAYKEKYDHQKLVNANQRLELEKAKAVYWLMLSIIIVLSLTGLVIYGYFHRKMILRRKKEELDKLVLQLHENESLMARNDSYISDLESRIAKDNDTVEQLEELQGMLTALQDENHLLHMENDRLQTEVTAQKAYSHELTDIQRMAEKFGELKRQQERISALFLEEHPFLSSLHSHPVYLDAEGLKKIRHLTDAVYVGFSERLLDAVPTLSGHDLIFCCLIKLHFSVAEMAVLLGISASSVSTGKFRLKNKIYAELGISPKQKNFDLWIWEY